LYYWGTVQLQDLTNIFRKKRFWVFAILLLFFLTINSCLTFRKSDQQIYKSFTKSNQKPEISYFKQGEKTIRFITAKNYNEDLPTVIFLHGSPGSSQDFYDYLLDTRLHSKANLIVLDRLGYGYSDFGKAETSIAKQATVINSFLEKKKLEDIVVVGWSFGGPIAVKMAIQNKEIDALLLLAPAIDPDYEKHFALGYLAKWKFTRWLVPKTFRVAEMEKLAHAKELTMMKNDWSKIRIPVVHVHGENDKLVPFQNLAFSKRMISEEYLTPVTVKDGGHLLPWRNYDLVQQQVLNLVSTFD